MSDKPPDACGSPNIDAIWQSLDVVADRAASSTPNGNVNGPMMEARPVRRKSRRSWFDKPSTKYEIAIEKKRRSGGRKSEIEDEVLLLTHFTKPPKIGFGHLKPGQHKVRNLLIRNPHEYGQTVKVEKFPHRKNFSVDALEFTVGANETFHFEITWNPEEEGNFREMILFVVDNSYRLQSFVFGSVEAPPKKKVTKRKGLLGSKVQKPFSVLHTQGLANIKKSYSPQKDDKKTLHEEKSVKDRKGPLKRKSQQGKVKKSSNEEPTQITSIKTVHNGMAETPEFLEINNENDPTTERRKSHRRSSTYVKMPDLGMSPIGLPPGTGKKTNINDILHSTVRSDCGSDASPQNIAENGKENCQGLPPKTPDDKKLQAVQNVTQGLVSPNSFLQDSICQQKDDIQIQQENVAKEKENLEGAKNFLSPDTFLKNLSSKVNKDTCIKGPLKVIPSPETVLNRSIPHEIVVQQLDSVKAELEKKMPFTNLEKLHAEKINIPTQQGNDRRETFIKSKNDRRLSKTGQRGSIHGNTRRESVHANKRRDTFEKQCTKKNPFVEVPAEITSSPRRTTYTVRQRKPTNKLQQKNLKSGNSERYSNEYKRTETDVVTTETIIGANTEIISTTTEHLEVVETYTCSVIEEEVVPTPERSLSQNPGKKVRTKTEISKVVDSNTVTKNRTLPTSEKSLCGKQLFSPQTGQTVSVTGDSSFGSPRRLPDSPLAAVNNKRSSVTVTKERPSDALVKQTERRLSTCLFADEKENDDLEADSLEDNKVVSTINEEDENCASHVVAITPACQTPVQTVLDTPLKEAGYGTRNIVSDSICDGSIAFQVCPIDDTPVRGLRNNVDATMDTPMRESGIMPGRISILNVNGGEISQPKEKEQQKGRKLESSVIPIETTEMPKNYCIEESIITSNLDTPLREMQPCGKSFNVEAIKMQKTANDMSSITVDTPLRNLDNANLSNMTETDNAKPKRRSFWGKPCDLSTTFDNVDTPLRNLRTDNDDDKVDNKRKSFWEKVKEGQVTTPSTMNGSGDSKSVCCSTPLNQKDPEEDEKNSSFPTTPYHMLPQKPNPDHSRRSTHVVEKPKVLSLDETQKKKLFVEEGTVGIDDKENCSDGEEMPGCNETKGFDVEIASPVIVPDEPNNKSIEKQVETNPSSTTNEKFTIIKDKQEEKENVDECGLFFISCSPVKKQSMAKPVTKQPIRPTTTKTNEKRTSPKRPLSHGQLPENKRQKTNDVLQGKSRLNQKPDDARNKKSLKCDDKLQQTSKPNRPPQRPINRGSAAVQGKVKPAVKGVAQSKLMLVKKTKTALPKHPLPFAAKNMYYDERWMQKQERGFVHWLNFVLTPLDEYQQTTKVKVDAGKICMDNARSNVKLAPTREVLSFRAYSERRRLNQLRRAACKLFQSKEVVHVVQKVEVEVESDRLYIRKDRKVHADLGLKQAILDMLLSFNPLWLRIGLETTFGELIMIQNNGDVLGLSRFIVTRILGNPEIANEFSHPSVPHLYKDGYAEAIARHLLKKFLILVYFLDHAKSCRLVPQDPCLFCKDAEYKTCKAMLIDFSKDYLAGEGDITRHLGYLGYQIKHQQTAMDEFDYAVTNLATDLKDGIRLARVMEILSEGDSLTKRLRAPAISRLQKIHNMDVVFEVLEKQGISVDQNGSKVSSRDVVDGHREKTLKLLWALIVQYQVGLLLNKEQLKEEIRILERSLRVKNQLAALQRYEYSLSQKKRDSIDPDLFSQNELIILLMKWCRVVCAFYNIKVENFTVSFGDGRVLCHLIHHYHPALLPRETIKLQTSITFTEEIEKSNDPNDSLNGSFSHAPYSADGDAEMFEKMLANEKENFKLLYEKVSELGGVPLMLRSADMSNTIPDEKVVVTYVSYLCARLLDIRHESRAARIIQLAWRRHHLKKAEQNFHVKQAAVITIQRFVRKCLKIKRQRKQEQAALTIQTRWRGYHARNLLRQMKWTRDNERKIAAATVIKRYLLACRDRRKYQQKKRAIITIQSMIRCYIQRHKYLTVLKAVTCIESRYKAYKLMAVCRSDYQSRRQNCIKIQKWWKTILMKRKVHREQAAVCIQAIVRGYLTKKRFTLTRNSLVKLQTSIRTYLARKHYLLQRNAAIAIQSWYRSHLVVAKCKNLCKQRKQAIVFIQSCIRRYLCFKKYKLKKNATAIIQNRVKTYLAMKEFRQKKNAAIKVQMYYRARLLMKEEREKFNRKRTTAIIIQSVWRSYKVRKTVTTMHAAATIIQTRFRSQKARNYYLCLRELTISCQRKWRSVLSDRNEKELLERRSSAATTIQSVFRGCLERRKYRKVMSSAVLIQSYIRGVLQKKKYLTLKKSTLVLQRRIRATLLGRKTCEEYLKQKKAALIIQSRFRGFRVREMVKRQNTAATKIQACYKAYKQRQSYSRLMAATCFLQSKWRALLTGRKLRREFLLKKGAAITLQAFFRGLAVRSIFRQLNKSATKIQAFYRSYRQRRHFLCLKASVLSCQSLYRAKMARDQHRRKYLGIKFAALTIQRAYRQYQVLKERRRLHSAAVLIQSCYKCFTARQKYVLLKDAVVKCQRRYRNNFVAQKCRLSYMQQKSAVLTIQLCVRGWLLRRRLMRMHSAATMIQSYYKAYIMTKRFHRMKQAAVFIQRHHRANILMSVIRQEYLVKKGATITLQAAVKGWKVRKEIRRKHTAATKIQSAFRCHLQQTKFKALQNAVMSCQILYRRYLLVSQTRKAYLSKRKSIINLQAAYRGWKVRRELRRQHEAATIIQSVYRGHTACQRYQTIRQATIVCQRRFRASLCAKQVRRQYLIQKGAVLTIEDWYCAWKQKVKERSQLRAATIIQSWYRAWVVRNMYMDKRQAAMTIQKYFRSYKYMTKTRHQYLQTCHAVTLIQTQVRGHLARTKYARDRNSVIKIQSAIKGYLHRRNYSRMKSSALVCQKRYRETKVAVDNRQTFLKMRSAAITIQSQFRGFHCRKSYRLHVESAVVIQKYFRRHKACQRYKSVQSSVRAIQTRWRATLLRLEEQRSFLVMKGATITIQAWWKGHQVRLQYKHLYEAVLTLQRCVRSKQQRKEYLVKRSSAIIIQSHVKALLKGRQARTEYTKMKESVVKIQALIRSYHARKLMKQIKACIIIQSHVRKFICLKKYQQQRLATVTVQSYYRGYRERTHFQRKLIALVKIQKCVKRRSFANRVKNYLDERRKCAIKIQSLYRGHTARKRVRQIKAAILIQALVRMRQARLQFLACQKKVTTVQCCVRRYLALKVVQKLRARNSAATCIQRCFRVYKERQILERQRQERLCYLRRVSKVTWVNLAAMVIQRSYRRHRLMQQARERLGKIIIIQRWIRSRLYRLRYLRFQRALVQVQIQARCYLQRRQEAAVTIQKCVKQWLVAKKQKLKVKAIVRIQAIWRGRQVRRESTGKKIEKIRKRVEEANRSATEEKKLGNRMASALDYLLKFKQLSHILEVLIHLDVATRLSPACCERFISVNAVQVIYRLMRGCNRSQPHMDLIKYSVSILLNLAKYDKTVYEVYNVEGSLDTLIELMQIYREKGVIFNSTCMLLGILGMLDKCRMEIRGDKKLSEKLRSIHCLTARKHKIDESRQLRQARLLAAKSFNSSLPVHLPQKKQHKIRPDWVLHKDKMKEIQDPLSAVNFVMDSFQLKPK